MPIAPLTLFEQVGLSLTGTVRWGELPETSQPGVYAISLCADPSLNDGVLAVAPVDVLAVKRWIARVPTFCFRGECKPNAADVADFLGSYWIADESIVYIGKATSLRDRLRKFRSHVLGDRKPHAGGHWLKALSNPNGFFVHYCSCSTVAIAEHREDEALSIFKAQVSESSRQRIANPIPFANREHPKGARKQSEIARDVLR